MLTFQRRHLFKREIKSFLQSYLPRKYIPSLKTTSTLVISTLLISNNHLTRSENLVHVLQGKLTRGKILRNFSSFTQYFQYTLISNFRSQIAYSFVKCYFSIYLFFFPNSANLICRGTDISNYFRESLGL